VLSVKKVAKPPFTKSVLILATALYATATLADISDALQLAQLSDGFNPEQKYMASCFACHSTGAAGAPKVGDGMAVEWEPRLEKGLDAVVANTVNGLNTMPAKGLCFDCTDDDLRAIVQYMIETSQ
jgi:cytochrome c5|tara:strand:- start:64 stop:441 length:378 start_codon:yes stop_codon:yes gene_type:complete